MVETEAESDPSISYVVEIEAVADPQRIHVEAVTYLL
jgi:hypothetical protein